MPFEDKQKITRAVIEKVETTREEATIYGRIPIFEGIGNDLITFNGNEEKVGFEPQDKHLVKINQHETRDFSESNSEKCEVLKNFTSGQVGFEFKDRNCWFTKRREVYII